MNDKTFKAALALVAFAFTLIFCVVVVPALMLNPDVIGAFAAGFVNPFAAGYSSDVILCWVALVIFVLYDAQVLSVRFGWVCVLLGMVPGVAVGLPLYLILRTGQINQAAKNT